MMIRPTVKPKRAFHIPIYRYDPTGYGDWGSPYYFASELTEEHTGYNGNGEKTVYELTDYNTYDHKGNLCRLYVPKGTCPHLCGLMLRKAK